MPAIVTIKLRKGTAAAWNSANPVLALGEPGLETDTKRLKFGDGVTEWNSLLYAAGVEHDRGTWDPTGNLYPETNGNYTAGVPAQADEWELINAPLIKDGRIYPIGTRIKSRVNGPGQTRTNWSHISVIS